ncbi:MAG: hypothetical protein H7124_04635 [Phycisphaerales bacterium]|nr:hypothetical protein [Hyphomonadaceae bacterium]
MRFARALASFALVVGLAACAVSDTHQQRRREAMTRRIVDDAIAFNEAYHGAITAQVLLNIMRASERQPRQYTSMSGFSQSGGARGASISVGGVQLDQLGESWGEGEFGLERSRPMAPDYSVSPFATQEFANIVLRPTDPLLFRYYWDSGWNPDLLLMLLVDRVRIAPVNGGAPRDLRNLPGTIREDCARENDEGGCAFVLAMRQLALDLSRAERIAAPVAADGRCGPFAVYVAPGSAATQQARRPATQSDPTCPVEIVVGDQRYLMALRSLDDVIYYIGHLMRRDPNASAAAPDEERRARLGVTAPGMPLWADERAPLFRIVEADAETERAYAATVTYAGRRFSAGGPNDRFCYVEGNLDACRGGAYGDVSGTVLELLVGMLAFNQSDEAVAPPQNSVLEIR